MAQLAIDPSLPGKGTLWAKVDNEGRNTITLKKAFLLALGVELAMLVAFFSIDFHKRWDDVRTAQVLKAITPESPPTPQQTPKKDETPPVKKIEKEKPKQDTQEAAPEKVEAAIEVPSAVSAPQAVGAVQQGAGQMTDTPSPDVRKNVSPSHRVKPNYPRTALRDGISGKVVVWLRVAPDGSVTGIEIKESRPPRVFDAEVRRALMQWKFAPEAVGFIAEIEVEFNLTDR